MYSAIQRRCYGGGLVTKSCPTLCHPWIIACPAPLSFPSLEDLPNPEIKPWFPALQADSLLTELLGNIQRQDNFVLSMLKWCPESPWLLVEIQKLALEISCSKFCILGGKHYRMGRKVIEPLLWRLQHLNQENLPQSTLFARRLSKSSLF